MRSLVCAVLLSIVGENTATAALSAVTFKSDLSSSTNLQQGSGQSSGQSGTVSRETQTLGVENIAVGPLTLQTSLGLSLIDQSKLELKNQRQEIVQSPNEKEWKGALSSMVQSGSHAISGSWKGSLNQVSRAQQTLGLEVSESFYQRSTVLGGELSYSDQHRPSDFYIDQNFKAHERPRKVQSLEVATFLEQVWTERWKSRVRISTLEKRWERPRAVGFELGNAYALSNHWFGQVKLSRFQELQSQELLDNRGRFDAWTGKAELSFEPHYDWLLTTSYALGVEHEVDPRILMDHQLGSDQFGLAVQTHFRKFRIGLNSTLIKTNTAASFFSSALELGVQL
jgi:hypothetical protein